MKNIRRQRIAFFLLGLVILPGLFFSANYVAAQSEAERLQSEINTKNNRLTEIEKEIAQFELALKGVGAEKDTLQNAINKLNLEYKKISADLDYTSNKITATDLEINKLTLEINNTEKDINKNEAGIAEIIRIINSNDNDSFIEIFLRHDNLAEIWNEIESLETVKKSMGDKIHTLNTLRNDLENNKNRETGKRTELSSLKQQFEGQQDVLSSSQVEKSQLLKETRNEEAAYQTQLQAKKEAREQLIREVREIESQLQFILDPNSIPKAGTAVFRWPLDKITLTQYFGYTKFALANPGVYKNNLHNGIDLGASIGTKIYAPLNGTVRMTGNTDAVRGCYSWGKWVLVDHPNGLATLYAHLSSVSVAPGQKLATGDIIGFVGDTGYATGPHLHFTVYVREAVQVKQFSEFKAVTGCGAALSPFSAIDGYLNPLDYLPSL